MAELTGIPLRTYRRLEHEDAWNPGIFHLRNCASVLQLDLAAIDPSTEWNGEPIWWVFDRENPVERPEGMEHFRPGRFK
jgi:hypothetical protein